MPGLAGASGAGRCSHGSRRRHRRLEGALHGSIERLQFYDSLVQHLSHVRNYLAGVAQQIAHGSDTAAPPPDVHGPADAAAWHRLRHQLSQRLLTDAQRELLDLVLPPGPGTGPGSGAGASVGAAANAPASGAAGVRPQRPPNDNIELF